MKRAITTTLRHAALAGAFLIFCTITSCGKSEVAAETGDETEATGTFKIDGVTYKGKTSIQTFINGNYSILCEQNEPYKFIQITFHSQAEAEKGGTFNAAEYEMDIPAGSANVGIDGLTFDPDGDFKITVANKKITITTLKLKQTGGGSKTAVVDGVSVGF